MLHNVSNRQILLAVLFILGSSTIFSQVNIKERVEIKPQPPLQKTSTEGQILFEENPVPNEGRDQGAAIIVVHPCQVTVTGSIEIEPIDQGGYPPTDLTMYSTVGGIVAWYKGYPDGSHYLQNGSLSYARYCGAVGVAMDNVSGIGLTGVTKNIGSASATIVFEGTLLRYWTFKATAVLSATIDESYDLASVELTSDATSITQCQNSTMLHTKLRNDAGEPYTGAPCQSPQPPMTLSVQSSSDVLLIYNGQPGKEITLPYGGDLDVQMYWIYKGETENSTAVMTMDVEGRTRTVTVDLIVDETVTGLLFDDAPRTIVHMLKAMVTIRGLGCGGSGPAPLADGTNIDLEITEGANWGFLRDPETGEQGTHLPSLKTKAGYVKAEYWAQGDNPSVWEAVKLRATSAEASATCRIDILAAGLKVTLGRPEIGFGDTTKVVVEQGNEDDGYTPIPTEWKTMYEIVEADTLGYFYAPDSSKAGSPLVGYYPETRFFAKNTSSPPDSMVLLLMITAVEPYGEVWDVKGTDGNKHLQGQVRAKTSAGIKKVTKSPGEKLMSDVEEPPNLGEGYYYYGAVQLVVKKKEEELDHFKVTLEKDTIAFTETSKIFVQAKDAKDVDISLSDEERLTYVLEGPQSVYGRFIDAEGDTALFVENARYIDAKQGLIKVAAVYQNPANPITARIKVVRASDPTKSGEVDIRIVEQTIRLVLYGLREIWPVLPPYTQEKSREDNRTLLEVQVTRNGKPLAGHPFELSTDYVEGSGGHDHTPYEKYVPSRRDTSGTVERLLNYGLFVSYQPNAKPKSANPIEEQTLQNGIAAFGYVASRFGDRMVLKVISRNSRLLWDTLSIVERVPNLELLPNNANYDKIGGTNQHHGPRDDKEYPNCRIPDNNHWGMEATIKTLIRISAEYHKMCPNDSILHLNDISLPWGGKFEVHGTWEEDDDHEYHRLGRDADVRSSTIPVGDVFTSLNDLNRNGRHDYGEPLATDVNHNRRFERNRDVFELLCKLLGTAKRAKLEPDPEHYHVYFWNTQER